MKPTACPTDAELAAFHFGDLPALAVERVAKHVEGCRTCDTKLAGYDERTDPILTALRQNTIVDPSGSLAARFAPTQPIAPSSRPAAQTFSVPGYDVLEQIGHGGMGIVHKARHQQLKRLVALKRLRIGSDWDRERFRTEAETVARLQHPNIVQIYETGELHGLPYLALEYIEGGNLAQLIGGRPQPARPSAELVRTLARAMQYAHDHGVVHRDLKPANILLQSGAKKDRDTIKDPYSTMSLLAFVLATVPKIADFGVAKCLDSGSGQTADGEMLGTPSYMAPEQARGRSKLVGPLADVYALGAILYELTTGRPPFDGEHPLETVRQVLDDDPVPPSRLQPRLPRDLETITLKCLQKDSARRYPSARALADDLDCFLDGRPITARPTPFWERLGRWAHRKPREALLVAAVAASIIAGFGLGIWQWYDARVALQAAGAAARMEEATRRAAERREARLSFDRGCQLCEQGDIGHGLLWLTRGLELAEKAGAADFDFPVRVALGDWARQLARPAIDLNLPCRLRAAAFSPDGEQLVAAGTDDLIRRWDPRSGAALGLPTKGPMASAVAIAPDGRRFLIGSDAGAAAVWDLPTTGSPSDSPLVRLAIPDANRENAIRCAAISADGRRLLTASRAGGVRLWDAPTGAADGLLTPEWQPVHSLAVSADGAAALVGGDHEAQFWNLRTRRPIGMALPHAGHVEAVAISADGQLFATGDDAGRIRLWSTITRQPVGPVIQHSTPVLALHFRPDSQRLAIAGADGALRHWNLPTLPMIGPPTPASGPLRLAAVTPSGAWLLTCTDRDAQVWSADRPTQTARTFLIDGQRITAAALSPDGRRAALGDSHGGLRVWDRDSGPIGPPQTLGATVECVRFDAAGTGLVTVTSTALQRWEVGASAVLGKSWDDPPPSPRCVAFPSSGRLVAIGCDDGRVRFYDGSSGRTDGREVDLGEPVTALAFAGDGRTLAVGGRDGGMYLIDVDERRSNGRRFGGAAPILALAFRGDGRVLLAGCKDGSARFWDVRSGLMLGGPLRHGGDILAVAYQNDGGSVWTAARNQAMMRWRPPAQPVAGSAEQLHCWAELLAGATLDEDGTVHPLDADQRRQRRERMDELGGAPKL